MILFFCYEMYRREPGLAIAFGCQSHFVRRRLTYSAKFHEGRLRQRDYVTGTLLSPGKVFEAL